nr:MAG TPA: Programmed cell death protein 7 [Herelleviridae sp.]
MDEKLSVVERSFICGFGSAVTDTWVDPPPRLRGNV